MRLPTIKEFEESYTAKNYYKLTKREQFAMAAMQGLLSDSQINMPYDMVAGSAVRQADVLLAALEKPVG